MDNRKFAVGQNWIDGKFYCAELSIMENCCSRIFVGTLEECSQFCTDNNIEAE